MKHAMRNPIEASNMTYAEYYHLNGMLSAERTESILSTLDAAQALDVREYASYAQEAQGGFPAEDFLSEVIEELQAMAKRLRGDNKDSLQHIISKLDDIAQCQFNAADYGREQLHKIIVTIKNN